MYDVDILYEVKNEKDKRVSSTIPIRIISAAAPSITVYGSEELPADVADMKDLASADSPFIVADWYSFNSVPRYIAFVGTADAIEVSNIELIERGPIS